MFIGKLTWTVVTTFVLAALCLGAELIDQRASGHANHVYQAQDKKKTNQFVATIKKIEGNQIILNASTKDKKAEDVTLTAVEKVKVTEKEMIKGRERFKKLDPSDPFVLDRFFTVTLSDLFKEVPVADGLKSKILTKEGRARITTDDKNNITEISFLQLSTVFPKQQ